MTVAVDPYLIDWLDFLLRWLHVIAGIVWIGTSFYFVALDNHLHEPVRPEDAEAGIGGEAWEVHGGGFYLVQKFKVAPKTLPEPLYWFKWEAYTTWLSGFALMSSSTTSTPTSISCIEPRRDVGHRALDRAARSRLARLRRALPRAPEASSRSPACSIALAHGHGAYGLSLVYTDRAVWLQLGAMLGTIMVANVFFVVIPAHWELIRAKEAGREPDPAAGMRGKQRSVHNNYLTLPVLIAMLGGHFAVAYGNADGWLVLVLLMPIGAWIRLFFNAPPRRHDPLVDAGRRRGRARRHRDLDPPAGCRRQWGDRAAGDDRRGAGDRPETLPCVPCRRDCAEGHPPRDRGRDRGGVGHDREGRRADEGDATRQHNAHDRRGAAAARPLDPARRAHEVGSRRC